MRRLALLIVFLLLVPAVASAQIRDCTTPNNAMYTFLAWQNPPNVDMKIATKCLPASAGTRAEAELVARKLKFVLDRRELIVNLDNEDGANYVPDDPDWLDKKNRSRVVIYPKALPQFWLERHGELWMISDKTVELADEIFDATPGSRMAELAWSMPPSWRREVLGVFVWQIIGLLLLIGLGFVAGRTVRFFARKILTPILERFVPEWGEKIARVIERPVGTLGLVGVWFLLLPSLQLYVKINKVAGGALLVLAIVSAVWAAYRLVDVLCDWWDSTAAKTESKLDDQLVPLARKTFKIFVVIVGGIFILQNLSVDVGALLAGLGIGGLAFALAAKDTIANLFGSVTIFADRPFQIGDLIEIDDELGTVEEVGFRSTRIRTTYNSLITIPNNKLANSSIDNYGSRQFRRVRVTLGVTYDATREQLVRFSDGIRRLLEENEHVKQDDMVVNFNDFGASSLDILVNFHLEVKSWADELQYRQEIFLDFMKLAEDVGVDFAFPTRTVHVVKDAS